MATHAEAVTERARLLREYRMAVRVVFVADGGFDYLLEVHDARISAERTVAQAENFPRCDWSTPIGPAGLQVFYPNT